MKKLLIHDFIKESHTADMPVKVNYAQISKASKLDTPKTPEAVEAAVSYWYNKVNGAELEQQHGLLPGLLKKMIHKESEGNPNAVSRVGASGLFGIMPEKNSGFSGDPFDPLESAQFAAKTMSWLVKHYKGSYERALAAYNWGMGKFARVNKDLSRVPRETRNYIKHFDSVIRSGKPIENDWGENDNAPKGSWGENEWPN